MPAVALLALRVNVLQLSFNEWLRVQYCFAEDDEGRCGFTKSFEDAPEILSDAVILPPTRVELDLVDITSPVLTYV